MNLDNVATLNLLVHFSVTFYMVGLLWFVQRVHYPLFAGVGGGEFRAYEQQHLNRISPIVAPPMVLEALGAVALVLGPPSQLPAWSTLLGLALVGVIWLSTFLLQVPCHRDLSGGFDAVAHQSLVTTNWIRTVAWSLRGALVFWMVFHVMARGAAS